MKASPRADKQRQYAMASVSFQITALCRSRSLEYKLLWKTNKNNNWIIKIMQTLNIFVCREFSLYILPPKCIWHEYCRAWNEGSQIYLNDVDFEFENWISLVLERRQFKFEYSWSIRWCKFHTGFELGLNFVGCWVWSCNKRRFSRRQNRTRVGAAARL